MLVGNIVVASVAEICLKISYVAATFPHVRGVAAKIPHHVLDDYVMYICADPQLCSDYNH